METEFVLQLKRMSEPGYIIESNDLNSLEVYKMEQIEQAKDSILKNPEPVKNYLITLHNRIVHEGKEIFRIWRDIKALPLEKQDEQENLLWHEVLCIIEDSRSDIVDLLISIFPDLLERKPIEKAFTDLLPDWNPLRIQHKKKLIKKENNGLTLEQIALIHIYNRVRILTDEIKTNAIAKSYGHSSGKKLYDLYSGYYNNPETLNSDPVGCTTRIMRNIINRMEKIRPFINDEGLKKYNEDLEALKEIERNQY